MLRLTSNGASKTASTEGDVEVHDVEAEDTSTDGLRAMIKETYFDEKVTMMMDDAHAESL